MTRWQAKTGLYTSIMCLMGYAVFGPSRILVLGPDSALGPMIAATILPLIAAGGDAERAVALASEFLAGNLAPPALSRSAGHISFPSRLR